MTPELWWTFPFLVVAVCLILLGLAAAGRLETRARRERGGRS